MPSQVHSSLHSGSLPISITLVLISLVFVHLRGWHQLRDARPTLSVWCPVTFVSGIVLLWVVVASPLRALDHQLLTAHMAQHLLLMNAAAPLILLGVPGLALLHGLPQRFIRGFPATLLESPPVEALGRAVTHPVFCWLASTAVVIGWHVPAVFEVGMRSAGWHEAEQASFFAAGLLFWWPVVQPGPSLEGWSRWRIPLYLFLATLPCDALSAFLAFCNRVVYSHYQSVDRLFELSPLGDQECAGALMWVFVTFAYLAPAAVVTIQLLSPRSRASQLEAI